MAEEKLTTIQIDVDTRNKLKALAEANERTSAGHLRWLVNLEFEKLQAANVSLKKSKRAIQTLPKAE